MDVVSLVLAAVIGGLVWEAMTIAVLIVLDRR